MPAGSQCENRIGTVRVKAPGGGTKRSSFIELWSHSRPRVATVDSGAERGYYSITSQARNKNVWRTGRPRALAALRLIASSNLSGDCAGKLPTGSPLRIRSTYELERRKISAVSGP